MRIHKPKCTFEFRIADIPENSPPDRALTQTRADQRDRTGRQ